MASAPPRPDYPSAARTLRDETVLDAVGELLADRAWPEVSMAEVAERSGVSRQTVYNAFGSREDLAAAYVHREADGFLAAVEEILIARAHEPREALAGSLEVFLTAVEHHPIVRAISTGEGDELLALVTARGGTLVEALGERLSALVQSIWEGVPAPEADLLADTFIRLAISHAALPAAPAPESAAALTRLLGPYVDELVAGLAAG